VVKPGHYAVFRLYVEAPKQDGLVEGEVSITTENEDIEIAFRLEVAAGTLEVTPESLVLDNCFPVRRPSLCRLLFRFLYRKPCFTLENVCFYRLSLPLSCCTLLRIMLAGTF